MRLKRFGEVGLSIRVRLQDDWKSSTNLESLAEVGEIGRGWENG